MWQNYLVKLILVFKSEKYRIIGKKQNHFSLYALLGWINLVNYCPIIGIMINPIISYQNQIFYIDSYFNLHSHIFLQYFLNYYWLIFNYSNYYRLIIAYIILSSFLNNDYCLINRENYFLLSCLIIPYIILSSFLNNDYCLINRENYFLLSCLKFLNKENYFVLSYYLKHIN